MKCPELEISSKKISVRSHRINFTTWIGHLKFEINPQKGLVRHLISMAFISSLVMTKSYILWYIEGGSGEPLIVIR